MSYTLEELRALPSQTDWAKATSFSEEELAQMDQDDPDLDSLENLDWSQAEWVDYRTKRPISIRLDADVLEHFKATGPRYQSRINAVLKSYMLATQKRRAKDKS